MSRRVGTVLAVTAVLAAVWGLWLVLYVQFGIGVLFCVIYRTTGLYCPGCGTMRAILSLCRLDLYQALRYNALFTLGFPALAVAIIRSVVSYIRTGRGLSPGKWDRPVVIVILAAAVLFGIARNIPALRMLAPTTV